jgi:hypothetical protein
MVQYETLLVMSTIEATWHCNRSVEPQQLIEDEDEDVEALDVRHSKNCPYTK